MHWKLMYPNEYVSAPELKGKDVPVTIAKIQIEELQRENGDKESKPVMYFKESPKKFVVNKTNAKSIATFLGKDTDNWVNQQIIIYPTMCNAFGEKTECIRVKRFVDKSKM